MHSLNGRQVPYAFCAAAMDRPRVCGCLMRGSFVFPLQAIVEKKCA
jgi:hypothetical protein